MPYVGAAHPEDHVFGDVGRMIRRALQVPRHQNRTERLAAHQRMLLHHAHQLVLHANTESAIRASASSND